MTRHGLRFQIARLALVYLPSPMGGLATFADPIATSTTSTSAQSSSPPASPVTVSVSPAQLEFGSQVVGTVSTVRTVTVTVAAPEDALIKIDGTVLGDFEVISKSCELKGPGICAISVTFAPQQSGDTTSFLNVSLSAGGATSTKSVGLTGKGLVRCIENKSILTRAGLRAFSPTLIVVLLYLLGIILSRWNLIARPTRNLLQAEIEAVKNRVAALAPTPGPDPPVVVSVNALLGRAELFIADKRLLAMLPDYFLWNRGQELSGWGCVHEAEEQMVSFLPAATVQADLERAESDLRQAATQTSLAMADQIHVALTATPAVSPDRLKALLSEALGLLYERTDNNFASLISWHNKTVWLVGCGLLFIASLAAALQHEVFFLLGATGGLLSRLSRSLYREDVPTDYGASWTTLFLSPVVGALAGWSGVLLIIVAFNLNIIGTAFRIEWCDPYTPLALGAALLLGTSERAFDGILSQLEDKIKAQPTPPQGPQPTALNIITPAGLPGGNVDQPYDQALVASGGNSPYKWTLTAGTLFAGLVLDPSGRLTGTPRAAGVSKFTLQVSDATAKTKSQEFTLAIS